MHKGESEDEVFENYIWFPAVHESSLILKFEMCTPQFYKFWLLNKQYYWVSARVKFDSSLFWSYIFTAEKNQSNFGGTENSNVSTSKP